MKTYKVPIVWQSIKTYEVEAESLQSAVDQALDIFFKEPDDTYIEDSFEIDCTIHDEYPDEDFDVNI